MRKQITLSIYGIIAMLILTLGFWSSFYPQRAYAQTFQVITNFAHPIIAMHYQAENDLVWILTGNTTDGRTVLYWVDRDTLSVIGSFNHTTSVNGGVGNRASDIWCGKTDCYITTAHTTHSVNGQLLRISTEDINPNIFRGKNVTGTYTHTQSIYHLTGRDAVSGGFGSVTIWLDACTTDPASCDDEVHIVDGISMLFVQDLKDFGFASNDWRVRDMQWSGIEGVTDNDLAIVHSSINIGTIESRLYVMNLATITQHCSVQTPTISAVLSRALSVATNYFSAGDANNKIYVGANSGHIFVYTNDCTLVQTINSTETGISNNIRYLEYSGGRVFFQGDGASAPIVQMLTNSSGHIIETDSTLYLPLPSSSQNVFDTVLTQLTIGDMILFSGFGTVWFPYTGTDKKVGILTYGEGTGGTGETVCIDINPNPDFTQLVCFEDNDGDGIPDSGAGAIGVQQNVTSSTNTLLCQIGFSNCNDDNAETNGTGLILLIALIIFTTTLILIATYKTGHSLNDVWIPLSIITFLDIGLGFLLNWIPDIIFYTVVALIGAMLAFGLYKKFGSGDSG